LIGVIIKMLLKVSSIISQIKSVKIMKKLLLFSACVLNTIFAMAQNFTVGDINYSVTSTNLSTVAVDQNKSIVGDLIIPSAVSYDNVTYTVTSIVRNAFESSGITSVSIPNTVTSIGEYAFDDCIGLTSITIPNSVTDMGDGVFYGCSGLTSITLSTSITEINAYTFSGCKNLTSINLPNSLTNVGTSAFESCEVLTSVSFPNSVTSLGDYMFYGCFGLESVDLPDSLENIAEGLFYSCSSMTSIEIPSTVTSIAYLAFFDCVSLTSITIPSSVTSIVDGAFAFCQALTSVTTEITTPLAIGSAVFQGCPINSMTLFVPEGTVTEYSIADVWKNFGTITESVVTNINNTTKIQNLVVFPNPSSGIFDIQSAHGEVQIQNLMGEVIYTTSIDSSSNTIDISNLANGVYFLKINDTVSKIVKE
jgi:hypothetical protein